MTGKLFVVAIAIAMAMRIHGTEIATGLLMKCGRISAAPTPHADPEQAAGEAEHRRLGQELAADRRRRAAEGLAQPDLAGPLLAPRPA